MLWVRSCSLLIYAEAHFDIHSFACFLSFALFCRSRILLRNQPQAIYANFGRELERLERCKNYLRSIRPSLSAATVVNDKRNRSFGTTVIFTIAKGIFFRLFAALNFRGD